MFANLVLIAILALPPCTGDAHCRACKSCKSCAHCKAGGSCGVCKPGMQTIHQKGDRCTRVVDGDTIVVSQDGKPIPIRLIGVDTPETKDPRKPIQYFGKEASEFTRKFVEHKEVRLQFDQSKTDRYGRTLAYVYVGNKLLNEEIIRQGYGHAYTKYPFDGTMMARFRNAEREAREHHRGLWGDFK